MGRSGQVVAAFILAFGLSGLSLAGSLDVNLSSLQVSQPDQLSLDGMQFAKATKAAHKSTAPSEDANLFEDSGMWLQVYTGFDFSFLGNITSGTKAWVDAVNAEGGGATASGGGNNIGVLASALWGFRLDKSNSLALDLSSIFTFGNNFDANVSGNTATQRMNPMCMSASLDYILDIANAPGSRTYITAGAGWYHAIVDDTFTESSPATVLGGSFAGDTVGGTLGIGEELDLGGALGLDLSIKGRFASIDKLTSTDGKGLDGNGNTALAMVPASGYTVIVPATTAGIDGSGGAIKYASADYSGIDAKVALNLYF